MFCVIIVVDLVYVMSCVTHYRSLTLYSIVLYVYVVWMDAGCMFHRPIAEVTLEDNITAVIGSDANVSPEQLSNFRVTHTLLSAIRHRVQVAKAIFILWL